MRALVTGAAGFIGSHLVDRLLDDGWTVLGVDCFSPYYERERKERNLGAALRHDRFELLEADACAADLEGAFDEADVLFHLAAQPGVRRSWGEEFGSYIHNNVLLTQRLLELAGKSSLRRVVYSSSSSVYGLQQDYPVSEEAHTHPVSPYGITKLAAEHLCGAYAEAFSLPVVSLRYFTVYGPRQRPDMAMYRLIESGLGRGTFPLYGTGEQIRDFTFVADAVEANLAAARADLAPGTVLNVAGGSVADMNSVIREVSDLVGRPLDIEGMEAQAGDVRETGGRIERATRLTGWAPRVSLRDGLRRQIEWQSAGVPWAADSGAGIG